MLSFDEYLRKFDKLQKLTVNATNLLTKWISPGQTEKEIANKYYSLLRDEGFTEYWYPTLIYSGEMTSKPISRRVHLPSDEIKVKESDIIFVDSTPMSGTVWSNWCDTITVGENSFYDNLINDVKELVGKTAGFARTKAKNVGDLYEFATFLIKEKNLIMLDPYKDIGHSIFQVPEHQTVDKTPMEDRLLLNETFKDRKLEGIISIEPQLGRVNLRSGQMYGAKLQEVVIF
jgi:Xaa-Pro aminopeptidase